MSDGRILIGCLIAACGFGLAACGETDGTEPGDANAQNSSTDGKGDETNAATGIMVEAGAVGLGTGSIVELVEVGDQWVAVDADCSDGCFHAFQASAGTLTEPVTTGSDFELGTITNVALARHVENGLIVSDDSTVAVVQLGEAGVELVSTTEFAGTTGILGLAAGAYLATDSAIHFANVREGALNVVLELSSPEENFTDFESGELRTSTFSPVGLQTGGEFLWAPMADGTVWRMPLNISEGISDVFVMGGSASINQLGYALEPVGITSNSMIRLTPGSVDFEQLFESANFVDVTAVDPGNVFVLDAERGPGLVRISTESNGLGEIDWQYEWVLFASFANYEQGTAFVDDEVGISSLIVREGVATLLVRP